MFKSKAGKEDEEETQEATAGLDASKEISVDAAAEAVLFILDGKEQQ